MCIYFCKMSVAYRQIPMRCSLFSKIVLVTDFKSLSRLVWIQHCSHFQYHMWSHAERFPYATEQCLEWNWQSSSSDSLIIEIFLLGMGTASGAGPSWIKRQRFYNWPICSLRLVLPSLAEIITECMLILLNMSFLRSQVEKIGVTYARQSPVCLGYFPVVNLPTFCLAWSRSI